jgi:outer membrane protein assembly factor BamD
VGAGRAVRVALIVAGLAGVVSLVSGCQSDPDIDITAYAQTIEPADVLYNQGLANLEAGQLTEAGRKFAADRQAASLFGICPQGDGDERLHQLPPG